MHEQDFRPDFVSQRPSGFISKGQVKLCLATEMKHLRFVEGQMPEHLPRRKMSLFCWHFRDLCPGTCGSVGWGWGHPREVAYPFLFLLAVPCGRFAVDGPSAARDREKLLRRWEKLMGEACGCSICQFFKLIHSAGEAPQYLPVLLVMNLATLSPFVSSAA